MDNNGIVFDNVSDLTFTRHAKDSLTMGCNARL